MNTQLEHMKKIGVRFSLYIPGYGFSDLSDDEIENIKNWSDLAEFMAYRFEIPVSTVRTWIDLHQQEDVQCEALTKKGKQCKNHVELFRLELDTFDPEKDIRCHLHNL